MHVGTYRLILWPEVVLRSVQTLSAWGSREERWKEKDGREGRELGGGGGGGKGRVGGRKGGIEPERGEKS